MRSKAEMMDLGMQFAQSHKEVRLFTLEGSRTNPTIQEDVFQDYDFSYFVTDMDVFKQNDDWLDVFGERILMQKPEDMELFPAELGNWFSYLMIFADGTKIDLTLIPLNEHKAYFEQSDGLVEVLLDKDDLIPTSITATDRHYHILKPSQRAFHDCCNEFWMTSTYVAKGLARKEILFAIDHMNDPFRPQLLTMLRWKVGLETGFSISIGKNDKFLKAYIRDDTWARLLTTYNMETYDSMWQGLDTCIALFKETAFSIKESHLYSYPDDKGILAYLEQMQRDYR
ncbi:aminoglycoside 6-adenylyltransferase [Aureibacillus halotolerans]|uniref:Aminoglycoside 6-adenylyltransferase n=1 Tax=Aureibacillus halotolerans TaxID=1508390 RepID=A0A4R6TWZ7_9BACI|nr:aminoglycoside 6-adenylyltransferase [Aureibacillus halotolerans]TDQ36375.1 aminoglycoside 6-adenylyltransferase [Aureibacillus halotolerans]